MSFEHIKHSSVPHFELVPQIGRVPGIVIHLNPIEEDRASQINREAVLIDFHSHPIVLQEHGGIRVIQSPRPVSHGLRRAEAGRADGVLRWDGLSCLHLIHGGMAV